MPSRQRDRQFSLKILAAFSAYCEESLETKRALPEIWQMLDRLPDLAIRQIVARLSHEDRFRLRRTCKTLKCLLDDQVARNLFVFLDCYPYRVSLFHTDQLVFYANSFRISDFDRFLSSAGRERFRSIRRLTIFFQDLKAIFNALDLLEIDLNQLNYFEEIEHLEIRGVGKVNGKLSLQKLAILLVETRRGSQFDLQCDQLRALRISWGARPNFASSPDRLSRLSIGLLVASDGLLDYLVRLLKACPKLSTVGSENLASLKFVLAGTNAGKFSLPLLRQINIEWPQYLKNLDGELIGLLAKHEERIKPERLRIVFNGTSLDLPEFVSIVQLHDRFTPESYEEPVNLEKEKLGRPYFNFLAENLTDLDFLYSGIKKMSFEPDDRVELNEALIRKLDNLEGLWTTQSRMSEELFETMLTTWTKLRFLYLLHPNELIGQERLEAMASHWSNLSWLVLGGRPAEINFVTKFSNLKSLGLCFNLRKDETLRLFRTCRSIEVLHFFNPSTDFHTYLMTSRYKRYEKSASQQRKFQLWYGQDLQEPSSYYEHKFDSLQQLVDHYYDGDFFNRKSVSILRTKFRHFMELFRGH